MMGNDLPKLQTTRGRIEALQLQVDSVAPPVFTACKGSPDPQTLTALRAETGAHFTTEIYLLITGETDLLQLPKHSNLNTPSLLH